MNLKYKQSETEHIVLFINHSLALFQVLNIGFYRKKPNYVLGAHYIRMKHYELTYLIPSILSEEELKTFQERINGHIQESGAILKEVKEPVRQSLTPAIKKHAASFLITLIFDSEPGKIADIEKKLKSESQILRYMILIKETPPLPKTPRHLKKEKGWKDQEPLPKTVKPEAKKVELKEIEKKIEEILKE